MELILSKPIPADSYVMLTENAALEWQHLLGSEAVMRVLFQSGLHLTTNGDGDITGRREYALEHQHRGRLILNVPEDVLQVVDNKAARGQRLIHDEMTRDLVEQIRAASDP